MPVLRHQICKLLQTNFAIALRPASASVAVDLHAPRPVARTIQYTTFIVLYSRSMLSLGKVWSFIGGSQPTLQESSSDQPDPPSSLPPPYFLPPDSPAQLQLQYRQHHRSSRSRSRSQSLSLSPVLSSAMPKHDSEHKSRGGDGSSKKREKKRSKSKLTASDDNLPHPEHIDVKDYVENAGEYEHNQDEVIEEGERKRKRDKDSESSGKKKKKKRKHHVDEERGEEIVLNTAIDPADDPADGPIEAEPEHEDHEAVPSPEAASETPTKKQKQKNRKSYKDRPRKSSDEEEPIDQDSAEESLIEHENQLTEEPDNAPIEEARKKRRKKQDTKETTGSTTGRVPKESTEATENTTAQITKVTSTTETATENSVESTTEGNLEDITEQPPKTANTDKSTDKSTAATSKRKRTRAHTPPPPPVIVPETKRKRGRAKASDPQPPPPPAPETFNKGAYTQAEDTIIQNVVHRFCAVQDPPLSRADFVQKIWQADWQSNGFWDMVVANLPHRQRTSLYKHVKRLYNDFAQRGVWSAEQDEELAQLVRRHGPKWSKIGSSINRMPEDCKDRWKNYVVCGKNRRTDAWDVDEEFRLANILNEMLEVLVAEAAQKGTTWLPPPPAGDAGTRAAWLEKEKMYHREEIDWGIVSEEMGHTRSRMQCRWKGKRMWSKISSTAGSLSRKRKKDPSTKSAEGKQPKRPRTKKKQQSEDGEGDEEAAADDEEAENEVAEEEVEEEEEEEPVCEEDATEASNMQMGDYFFILQQISLLDYDNPEGIDWHKIAERDNIKHFTAAQLRAGFKRYLENNDNGGQKDLREFVKDQLAQMKELPATMRSKRHRPAAGAASSQQTPQRTQPGLSVEIMITADARNPRQPGGSSQLSKVTTATKPAHSPSNPFSSQRTQPPSQPATTKERQEKTRARENKKEDVVKSKEKKEGAVKVKERKKEKLEEEEDLDEREQKGSRAKGIAKKGLGLKKPAKKGKFMSAEIIEDSDEDAGYGDVMVAEGQSWYADELPEEEEEEEPQPRKLKGKRQSGAESKEVEADEMSDLDLDGGNTESDYGEDDASGGSEADDEMGESAATERIAKKQS
ncbi:hypothetical protein Dda_5812 [Drechslerella dactyloides]|uniref:Uncharacterized protein n=1 Tax=Drechslerella dactyloides TaxID=74499 RepID=A0AAD6IV45_DREDA|nr:hypothetical protein Dda_5812 [Drechslerella dactyloides]